MIGNKYNISGRRLGIERRVLSYFLHIPERRSGMDARSGKERRQSADDYYPETEEKRSYGK